MVVDAPVLDDEEERQVGAIGSVCLLVMGLLGGCMVPRIIMPASMQTIGLFTPHAWALDAYAQLLASPNPDVSRVWLSCGVLLAFGAAFTALA